MSEHLQASVHPGVPGEAIELFPLVYAVEGLEYLDYGDQKNVHHINYHHVLEFKFMNLVAGFDRQEILFRLSGLKEHLWRLNRLLRSLSGIVLVVVLVSALGICPKDASTHSGVISRKSDLARRRGRFEIRNLGLKKG